MKKILSLVLLFCSISAFSQVGSQEAKNKLEYLQAREKNLKVHISQMQDSLATVQASINVQQKIYDRTLIEAAVDSLRAVIGKGIKMNTGGTMLLAMDNASLYTPIDKNQNYLLTGVDSFPIYFIQYKRFDTALRLSI
jgi:hypothetical protein